MSDSFYRAFEDRYRGSRDLIKDRLTAYRPFVSPLLDIYHPAAAIDLGCGRGEWLELLSAWGFTAKGVDLDVGMLSAAQELGFEVAHGDAIAHLTGQASDSTAIVSAFHLVEHLPFDDLRKLIGEALRVLKPGGLLIMETPNPENIVVATRNFYLDPTHQKPIPSDLLAFAAEHAGFDRVKTVRLQESKSLLEKTEINLVDAIGGASPDYAVVAQKEAPKNILSRFDEAFSSEYGLSQDTLLNRFDAHLHNVIGKTEAKAQQAEAKAQQAEALSNQALTQLQAVYASTSWQITRPLRWVGIQLNLLKQHGIKGRVQAFARKVLPHLVAFLRQRPTLKRYAVAAAYRLGVAERLRRFYQPTPYSAEARIQGYDIAPELHNLTPHARQIYTELKNAIENRKAQN